MRDEIENLLGYIDWASNTHKDKLMFGMYEPNASLHREHRIHGVLMDTKRFIIKQEKELQETREQLEKAEGVLKMYASRNNWNNYKEAIMLCEYVGGETAREYFKQKYKLEKNKGEI